MVKPMSEALDEYQVFSPCGTLVLGSPESCRYPKLIELSIMEAGYTIRLHGEKLTRKQIKAR